MDEPASPVAAEALSLIGFDWLMFDTEHAPVEIAALQPLLLGAQDLRNRLGSAAEQGADAPGRRPKDDETACQAEEENRAACVT